ncbi:hypothetical protein [Mycolicibacterium sp. 050158]|uniref:hypothetical protein n=1 Tax=Mycolicibacterium sp. 050158 TaxID=3090602 RepID=UPI00299EFD97|nr:hypothetical protein [Mycolicibacterium sp. 050158]MDX1889298.1 hypothetical protein [Mycolicibacterium sp. 050158]
MAVLGINVAGAVAYCAILEGASIIESEPFKLEAAPGMSVSAGLNALANDVELLVSERAITRIVIVGPENSYKGTYVALKRPGSVGGSSYWISTRVWSVRCAS